MNGPNATPQQLLDAQLVTFLYSCWSRLEKLKDECSDDVLDILRPGVNVSNFSPNLWCFVHSAQHLRDQCTRVIDPLLSAVRRELAAIIASLHKLDFSRSSGAAMGTGGVSIYMEDLVTKLSFIKTEIMDSYVGVDVSRQWSEFALISCLILTLLS